MSNPNVINNDNGNRTEGIARKGIATALAAIVTPFLFTACKADIATASAPSTAPNTPLPAASAPANPGSQSTITADSNWPLCTDLVKEQNKKYVKEIKGFFRYGDDVNNDGKGDPEDINGKTICV